MTLSELQQRLPELNSEQQEILARADAEKRDLTSEEESTLEGLQEEFDRVSQRIAQIERFQDQTDRLSQGKGRKTQPAEVLSPDEPAPPVQPKGKQLARIPAEPIRERKGGFHTLGEMAFHVYQASRQGATPDTRLQRLAAASTYGSEGVGADGGFAVPPDFRNEIMVTVLAEDSLASLCDQVPVSGNSFTAPTDETTPWQTSGGILAYWDGEAVAATQSKPSLQNTTVKLHKLRALVPMTEELLEDAAAMDAYLRRKAPEKIAFKLNLAIVQGTGVGQPLGILASGATVSVAKESGQVADTIVGNNITKMYSRMYAPSRSRGVWLINQDIEPMLLKLSLPGTDNTGNAVTGWGSLCYLPANGFSGSPFATLFGRPVIPTQACETLGDLGDILFIDPKQYLLLLKSGQNPRVETSMHLWFDQDLVAFKFILRVGGQPWWSTTVAARDGSATYSPFVTLAERA